MENLVVSTLCSRIYDNHKFREDFEHLVKKELTTKPIDTELSSEQIKRLSESAIILSLSSDLKHQKLAFKISVFLLNQFKDQYKTIPFAVELVLTRLGDLPTILHMYNAQHGNDYFSYFHESAGVDFSSLAFPEVIARKMLNQFEIHENMRLTLTSFQADILRSLLSKESVSFSAPTSAGKSYVIHSYIAHEILNSPNYTVVYLVPTKSLIAEVQGSILEKLHQLPLEFSDIAVVNSADYLNTTYFENVRKKVLVLTPERLQYTLAHNINLDVNLLVIDEAQKVKDEERGVILEDAVGDLIDNNPYLQAVIISPYISNPMKFRTIFDLKQRVRSVSFPRTPVGQNIFYVNIKKGVAVVSLLSEEFERNIIEIEKIPITKVPTAQFRIKSWIVNSLLKGKGHTLVYCNRPIECVQVAGEIASERDVIDSSQELTKAIDFLRSHVHQEYYLTDHLTFGIGYHYGRMPQFVRFVVKELFENKRIEILCCTSTLLEGVNLPAKNIVLYKPKAGMQKAMDKFSIKNLAGRAGRLGKDYYGNIYCIDIDTWKEGGDAFDEELETIESSVEKTLSLDADSLLEHLERYAVPPYGKKNVAAVATSLIVKQLRNPEIDFLGELSKKYPSISNEKMEKIRRLLKKISDDISSLDKEIVLRNSSIDPRLQYNLYTYLQKKGNLVLPPEPWFETFYNDLLSIFRLIQEFFFKDDPDKSNYKYYAFVANQWINQGTYKQILESRIRFLEEQKKRELTKSEINASIDRVDEILESVLKYDYTRGLRCYCDIVDYIIKKKDLLVKYSRDLPEYLETGAYDKRVFLLLSVGISRNSAITIAHEMSDNIDTIPKCLYWLRENKLKIRDKLHELMYRELEYLLESMNTH